MIVGLQGILTENYSEICLVKDLVSVLRFLSKVSIVLSIIAKKNRT